MSVKYGLTSIGAIYKGLTGFSSAYKGLTLVFSSYTWENAYFEYLYNSLVPSTVAGKNVLNKARIKTLIGNSVVENQLVENGNFESTSGWYTANSGTITASDNVCHFVSSVSGIKSLYRANSNYPSINNSHKYLMVATIKTSTNATAYLECGNSLQSSQSLTANIWTTLKFIASPTSTSGFFNVLRIGNLDVDETADIKDVYMIDLTQRYPFDTPTSLDDVRVQALINRGYIAPNTGTLKNVDIGEISSEPYNLFDGELEGGSIDATTGQNTPSSNHFRIVNYISVIPNLTYIVEYNRNDLEGYQYVFEYDENYNFIQRSSSIGTATSNIQLTSQTHYIRLAYYKSGSDWGNNVPTNANICIHRTGTRTGYAPHKSFSPLSFKYQGGGVGTSHDTMEITSSEVVFTKDRALLDLGSINYTYDSGNNTRFYSTLTYETLIKAPSSNDVMANIICGKYTTLVQNTLLSGTENNAISLSQASRISIRNTSYTDATTFKTAMSGVMLEYQLATPQAIRIPKKHLGIVDLGSLNFTSNPNAYGEIQSDELGGIIKPIASPNTIFNGYCSRFITTYANDGYHSTTKDNLIWLWQESVGTGGRLTMLSREFIGLNIQQVKTLLSGVYLFYETEDEVADIPAIFDIESGGTITTDSEVLPNAYLQLKAK